MKEKNSAINIFKRLLKLTRPYRIYLILALLFATFSVVLSLYAPILIGAGIDHILGEGSVNFDAIYSIILKLGIVAGLEALFRWLMTLCTNTITHSTVKDLRIKIFEKYKNLPLSYIDTNAHGDLISRVTNDVDQISDGLIQGFSQLFTGVITIIGTLAFMVSINVFIAIVVVVLTPLSLFVASFIAKRTYIYFRRQSDIRGDVGAYIEEMIGNQKIVKTFGYENRACEDFEKLNTNLYDVGINAQFFSSMTNPCTRFVNGLVYACVGIVGAVAAVRGRISVGQLSSFLSYANQYTKPFNEITGVITELQTAIAGAARVFEVLDEKEQSEDMSDARNLQTVSGNVNFENVSFSYTKDKPLIKDFSIDVKQGQRIAIVGPTGCGKTTLINLLMRFYDVNSGVIYIEGIDTKEIARNSLRSTFGMVLQETWMFKGSIKDNISYGKPNASMEEIIAAAKSAHAHSFIKRLPKGYNTVIGENGGGISQGQRQLLCIARIMLIDAPMLILDEATSSIDTRTEKLVQKAFDKMMEGRTSFVVAHRLSTIREADCILVMKSGNIIERGNHEILLKNNGFYANLYRSSFEQA
jgi:ABC-type multidrug transport system, ATPase and permease components